MIDISDGLGADAGHLASASGCRSRSTSDRVPVADGSGGGRGRSRGRGRAGGLGRRGLRAAGHRCPRERFAAAAQAVDEAGTKLTEIGYVDRGPGRGPAGCRAAARSSRAASTRGAGPSPARAEPAPAGARRLVLVGPRAPAPASARPGALPAHRDLALACISGGSRPGAPAGPARRSRPPRPLPGSRAATGRRRSGRRRPSAPGRARRRVRRRSGPRDSASRTTSGQQPEQNEPGGCGAGPAASLAAASSQACRPTETSSARYGIDEPDAERRKTGEQQRRRGGGRRPRWPAAGAAAAGRTRPRSRRGARRSPRSSRLSRGDSIRGIERELGARQQADERGEQDHEQGAEERHDAQQRPDESADRLDRAARRGGESRRRPRAPPGTSRESASSAIVQPGSRLPATPM